MQSATNLAGRTALVTGSSKGIGRAIAEALADAGARLVIHGRDAAVLAGVAAGLPGAERGHGWVAGDLDEQASARDVARRAIERHGRIDILVNNAGINIRKGIREATAADWSAVIDLDLTACFALAQEVAPGMVEGGWGRIVNVGSVMSVIARSGIPAYAAAKHGLAGLTKALAAELGASGVTVNAVAPGFVMTDLTRAQLADPDFAAMVRRRTPAGRWGEPREIGSVVAFLASDAASYVNGHVLLVDGGLTATV